MVARQKVNLAELEIDSVKARRAKTGAIIYEISGADNMLRRIGLRKNYEKPS